MAYEIVGGVLYDLDTGNAVNPEHVGLTFRPLQGGGGRQLGANVARQMLPLAPALRQAAQAALPAGVREVSPTRVDETPLPITPTSVAAGSASDISMNAQIIFAPRRLIVPDSIAPFFVINSLNVGNIPLFAGNGSIPAEAFRPDSVNPNVRKVTAQPGMPITINVTNVDSVAHTFRAAIFGEGMQPYGC